MFAFVGYRCFDKYIIIFFPFSILSRAPLEIVKQRDQAWGNILGSQVLKKLYQSLIDQKLFQSKNEQNCKRR